MVMIVKPVIESPGTVEMGDLTGGLPSSVVLWQVNFDEEADEFRLVYRRVAVDKIAEDDTISEAQLKAYLTKVISRTEPSWQSLKPGSDQTGPTPLSIHHLERSIMVFVMRHEKRWEFAAGQFPFEIEDGRQEYYMMARGVVPAGASVDLVKKPGTGCRVAMFVANAAGDREAHGTGNDKAFRSSFNIYVDLLLKRSDNGPDRRMPIAIDPDVGHPGGSEAPLP